MDVTKMDVTNIVNKIGELIEISKLNIKNNQKECSFDKGASTIWMVVLKIIFEEQESQIGVGTGSYAIEILNKYK